jgi:hypothetical protein
MPTRSCLLVLKIDSRRHETNHVKLCVCATIPVEAIMCLCNHSCGSAQIDMHLVMLGFEYFDPTGSQSSERVTSGPICFHDVS